MAGKIDKVVTMVINGVVYEGLEGILRDMVDLQIRLLAMHIKAYDYAEIESKEASVIDTDFLVSTIRKLTNKELKELPNMIIECVHDHEYSKREILQYIINEPEITGGK